MEPPSGLNRVKPPLHFGERARDCSPGHAGKERPSPREDGGVSGVSSSCGALRGFLARHDEDLRVPLVRRQGSQVSMRVARGNPLWLSSNGRGLGPQDTLKRDSRGLSRVVASFLMTFVTSGMSLAGSRHLPVFYFLKQPDVAQSRASRSHARAADRLGARGGFLPRHDEDLRVPLVRRQGSHVSMHVARRSASLFSSHGRA